MNVFVTGYGGSGTRVPMMIFDRASNYKLPGNKNEAFDHLSADVLTEPRLRGLNFNPELLKNIIEESQSYGDNIAIKTCYFMYCIKELKEIDPDSKMILVIRHGVDNILNAFNDARTYYDNYIATKERSGFLMRIRAWKHMYEKAIHDLETYYPNAHMIIKLEDITNRDLQGEILDKMIEVFNIEGDDLLEGIRRPDSIGRREASIARDGEIWPPEARQEFFDEAKELMERFGYLP